MIKAFSPDGRRLLIGTKKGDVLLAETAPAGIDKLVSEVKREALPVLWAELGSSDAGRAYRAASVLIGLKDKGTRFLADQVRPAPADSVEFAKLIRDLEAPRYVVRLQARRELAERGAGAAPALKSALRTAKTPQASRALTDLLAFSTSKQWPNPLRRQPAGWVLQRIGTPDARKLLVEWPERDR